jgi:DNA polymerase-1
MIQTQEFLNANNTKSRMIMQVHDELVFDVYPAEEEILKKGIIDIMENILDTSKISLKVDV